MHTKPTLDRTALTALGATAEAILQYVEADTSELQRSWFCVLFDQSVSQLQQVSTQSSVPWIAMVTTYKARHHVCSVLQC